MEIYVLAGQSNMAGRGDLRDLPAQYRSATSEGGVKTTCAADYCTYKICDAKPVLPALTYWRTKVDVIPMPTPRCPLRKISCRSKPFAQRPQLFTCSGEKIEQSAALGVFLRWSCSAAVFTEENSTCTQRVALDCTSKSRVARECSATGPLSSGT